MQITIKELPSAVLENQEKVFGVYLNNDFANILIVWSRLNGRLVKSTFHGGEEADFKKALEIETENWRLEHNG